MPEPTGGDRRYMPGLDGLRAIAVLGVLAYHLGITALPGGFLGVSVFFTLSGYLITDLIVERADRGAFTLRSFWAARARRLIPAMLAMITAITAWVTIIGPQQDRQFRSAVASAASYVNNWWLVARDLSYFDQFRSPGPLNHLWSLAVEEQFYIVWPLVVVGLLAASRRWGGRHGRYVLACSIGALAACSALLLMVMFEPGADPSRVYYGTDTRSAELLVGALLAVLLPSARLAARVRDRSAARLDLLGVLGLCVIALMMMRIDDSDSFMYRGGFVVLPLAVAASVAALVHPRSRLAGALGTRVLRWIGTRSYGLYLWHFPVIVLSTAEGVTGTHWLRTPLQALVSICLAEISWVFVEDPVRHGALGRLWNNLRHHRLRGVSRMEPTGIVALGATLLLLIPAVAGLAGVGTRNGARDDGTRLSVAESIEFESLTPSANGDSSDATTGSSPPNASIDPDAIPSTGAGPDVPLVTDAPATSPPIPSTEGDNNSDLPTPALTARRTACTSVIHVGDSTSTGLVTTRYLAVADQSPAQYRRVGVRTLHLEIAGGRSINEGYKEGRPARRTAEKWRRKNYSGCWVLALGTMDVARVAKGSNVSLRKRISMMMDLVGNDPVMWVNLQSRRSTGAWKAANMVDWNAILLDECSKYPNMRIYDWYSDVERTWYQSDGIHQNTPGYRARARNIANALAQAFPEGTSADQSAGCLVRLPTSSDS